LLIVSDGTFVTYYDYELEQVSHIPLQDNLATIIASKDFSLTKGNLIIDSLEIEENEIKVAIYEHEKREEGLLTLFFERKKELDLEKMEVLDATGQKVTLFLKDTEYNIPVDRELFIFKDPRGVLPRKRR
jgi:outer membrane lipoprotein-sorting protein